MTTEIKQVLIRDDSATDWTTANPVLGLGEPGWDATNKVLKIGDGATAWADLEVLFDDTYVPLVEARDIQFGVGGVLGVNGAMTELVFDTYGDAAPFVLCIGGNNPFNSQQDDLFLWGYNRSNGGARKVLTEPSFGFQIEAHVKDSSDSRFPTVTDNFEWNLDYGYANGDPGLRMMAFRADRDAPADYTHWLFHISDPGTLGYFKVEAFDGTDLFTVSADGDVTIFDDVTVGGRVTATEGFYGGGTTVVSIDAPGSAAGRFAVDASNIRLGLPVRIGGAGLNDVVLERSSASTAKLTVGSRFVTIGDDGAGHLDINAAGGMRLYASSGGITIRSDVGFHGTTPIAKRAATADATDLASVITLANAIKADLVAYGLKTA